MKTGISIIIPAYQEGDNLQLMLPEIHKALAGLQIPYEILVIDTQQPMDQTPEVCRKFQAFYCPRERGNYYGDAVRTGISRAQYSFSVIMDGDGSHDVRDIIRMLELMEQNKLDLVIGSRYIDGGCSFNGPISKFMSASLNFVFRLVFHIKVQDFSNSFRMYRSELLKHLDLRCNNFDIVEEILIRLADQKDFRFEEIPIIFSKRKEGVSKRKLIPFYCQLPWYDFAFEENLQKKVNRCSQ